MKEEKKMVPKLRFPEFEEPWVQVFLGNLGQFYRGLTYGADDVAGEGLLVLRSSNIQDGQLVLDSDLVFVKKQCPPQLRLRRGDVAICMSNGSKALVGKSGVFNRDYSGALTVGAFCSIFRPTTPFAKVAFSTPRYEGFVATGIAGGNINNLKNSNLEAFEFPIPTSPAEQQKIADCLSSLDELIAAQARKVDALKTHKKGLMQQLFPREGETQPRLRFPEFRDAEEWTQKALGDIADVLMCKRIFANETNPTEGVPFYKIGTLGGTPDAFISQDIFSDYKQRYNYPRLGEVLITCSGTIGKCLPFNGSDSYFQDSNIVWIDNSTLIVTNQFLLSILSSVDWSGLNSTTITRIYGPDLRGLVIKFPQDHLEQQRIANCLTALDDVITSAIQELATLKTHKKGLMQQLFPSAAELAA